MIHPNTEADTMSNSENQIYHVVDWADDCVIAPNIPTLEQAEQILEEGYGGLMIIENDQLTPGMIAQIKEYDFPAV